MAGLSNRNDLEMSQQVSKSARKTPAKRKLDEARRRQNREAQRRYRERRRSSIIPVSKTNTHGSMIENAPSFDTRRDQNAACPSQATQDNPTYDGLDFLLDPLLAFGAPTATSNPPDDHMNMDHIPNLPSPYINYLQLQQLNFYIARIQNALHLGVPLRLAEMTQKLPSPWYLHRQLTGVASRMLNETPPAVINSDETCTIERPIRPTLCFELAETVIPELAPTSLQMSHPHELYIDTIPFPVFRDRVITLLAMNPPAFNGDELKRDIESEGLLIWGAAQGADDASARVARDTRNWECAKWFLKKWKLLVSGSGLEEQSRWWRTMRGEVGSNED